MEVFTLQDTDTGAIGLQTHFVGVRQCEHTIKDDTAQKATVKPYSHFVSSFAFASKFKNGFYGNT